MSCGIGLYGDEHDDTQKPHVKPDEAKTFRYSSARCNFLSSDLIDIKSASKEIFRRLTAERCCKMLNVVPRAKTGVPSHSRRSTNGCLALLGEHLIQGMVGEDRSGNIQQRGSAPRRDECALQGQT